MKAVEVTGLVKDYGDFRALKGISFELKEGDVWGWSALLKGTAVCIRNSDRLLGGSHKRVGRGRLAWRFGR